MKARLKRRLGIAREHIMQNANTIWPGRSTRPNSEVLWLSHHIPKTAGSSLFTAFSETSNQSFKVRKITQPWASQLSSGQSIWLPRHTKIVHGHFVPHSMHLKLFPNAQRLIWIRDPADRAISLMHYCKRVKSQPFNAMRLILENEYFTRDKDIIDLLEAALDDDRLRIMFYCYAHFLQNTTKNDYAFIGFVEQYIPEISRLATLMQLPLEPLTQNIGGYPAADAAQIARIKAKLQTEYQFLNNFLDKHQYSY